MLFKEKQTIFPLGLGYCFCLLLGTLLTLIAGIACFIWTLCGQNQTGSLIIFGNDTILNRFLEGFLWYGDVTTYHTIVKILIVDGDNQRDYTLKMYKAGENAANYGNRYLSPVASGYSGNWESLNNDLPINQITESECTNSKVWIDSVTTNIGLTYQAQ